MNALLVIDLQNDYFPGGKFPLWNAEGCRGNIIQAIRAAQKAGMPVILVQHVAEGGLAPFFVDGTPGTEVVPEVRAAAPEAPVVVKHFADSFHQTELESTLQKLGVTRLLVCGMMTQNCVTFTALSKAAEKYRPAILTDCCTTASEMLHNIALNALSTRVELTAWEKLTSAAPAANTNSYKMKLDGFGIFVTDMAVMIRFYRDVLGFEIKESEDTNNVYLVKDGTLFLLYGRGDFEKMTGRKFHFAPQINGHYEIALGVENYAAVDAAFAETVSKGATAVMPPTTEPWGQRTCYIADPEGNLVEIGSFTK